MRAAAHASLRALSTGCNDAAYKATGKEALEITAITLSTLLEYGVTSVREVGGYGCHLKTLVNEGSLAGPNIYAAGKFLNIIGGHTDVHGLPLAWMGQLSQTDNIKFHATGGAASVHDELDAQQFSEEMKVTHI